MASNRVSTKASRPRKRRTARIQAPPVAPVVLVQARALDRQADAELFLGHHAAAERLSLRAAELRGVA